MKTGQSTHRILKWLFTLCMVAAVFTGFGNMPLYKRYYVADLPGMGWSGDFFANLQIHILTGAILLGIAVHFTLQYAGMKKKGVKLTPSGAVRAALIGLLLMSGIVMVLKNFQIVAMGFPDLIILNFIHLFSAMIYLLVVLVCSIAGYRWQKPVS